MNRKKLFLSLAAAAVALTPLAFLPAFHASAATQPTRGLLWEGTASKGTGVFHNMNCDGKTFGTVKDPQYGTVWRAYLPKGDKRCEAHGTNSVTLKKGGEYYLGWRSKFDAPKDDKSRWVFQLKAYGEPMKANYPELLWLEKGNLSLRNYDQSHKEHNVWNRNIQNNQWMSIVIHVKLSTDPKVGFLEFWYNGQPQKLSNGSTRFYTATWDAGQVDPKWGVYHQTNANATQWLTSPRIGTSYADVAP